MVITATVLLSGETAASATNTLEKFSWMISFRLVLLTLYTVTAPLYPLRWAVTASQPLSLTRAERRVPSTSREKAS